MSTVLHRLDGRQKHQIRTKHTGSPASLCPQIQTGIRQTGDGRPSSVGHGAPPTNNTHQFLGIASTRPKSHSRDSFDPLSDNSSWRPLKAVLNEQSLNCLQHPAPTSLRLVDGEIVGTWRRSGHKVTVHPWQPINRAGRESIEKEAASMPLPGIDRSLTVTWED